MTNWNTIGDKSGRENLLTNRVSNKPKDRLKMKISVRIRKLAELRRFSFTAIL